MATETRLFIGTLKRMEEALKQLEAIDAEVDNALERWEEYERLHEDSKTIGKVAQALYGSHVTLGFAISKTESAISALEAINL